MPGYKQQAPKGDRFAHTDKPVGNEAAQHGHGIDKGGVAAQYTETCRVGEQVVLGEIEEQQILHAVEGETLPQFRGEADV